MNLGDLLAYTRGSVLKDVPTPQQWSDVELTQWLNDAENIWARRTFCLLDDTSDFTQVTTVATQRDYTLDARLLGVSSVKTSDDVWLRKFQGSTQMTTASGTPRSWLLRGTHTLVLWPTPDAAYTLQLMTARLPLTPMEVETDEPEIPEHYHLALCDWAGYRALRNTDSQTMADVRDMTILVRKDWERALVEGRREAYFNQRGA